MTNKMEQIEKNIEKPRIAKFHTLPEFTYFSIAISLEM